jgi:hypothetical protein
MITDNDVYYFANKFPDRKQMALGFGMNGKIIIDIPVYHDFYELLKNADEIRPVTEDYSTIDFIKNGAVIETFKTSSFLGSLIASKPDLIDIYTYPNQAQYEKNVGVQAGYLYNKDGCDLNDDSDYNFLEPHEGWAHTIIDGKYAADKEYSSYEFYTGD